MRDQVEAEIAKKIEPFNKTTLLWEAFQSESYDQISAVEEAKSNEKLNRMVDLWPTIDELNKKAAEVKQTLPSDGRTILDIDVEAVLLPWLRQGWIRGHQGRIPIMRGPRHIPGAGPLPLYASPLPPTFFPPYHFTTQPLSSISLSLFVRIFNSSFLLIFLFFPFFSFFLHYFFFAGPPEARGPRHVPFVPLWGSGTGGHE